MVNKTSIQLKGGTKSMKNTAIAMTAILLIGLFLSMGFTSAISANANVIAKAKAGERSVSIGDVEDDEDSNNDFDISAANEEIDDSVAEQARESTFAQVSIGQGWVIGSDNDTNESEGSFARIFWVEKTFVTSENESTNETNQTNTTETTEARGTLKIGYDLYKLVLDSQTNDSMVFDVRSEKARVNGTLELESEVSLAGFTVWSGTLELDSGKTYDIHVATKNSKVKGSDGVTVNGSEDERGLQGNLNAEARGQGKKLGLFARIRDFFRGE